MPCNAVVYLPATIRQLDTTAMFASSATLTLTAKMLEATLAALVSHDMRRAYENGTDITPNPVRHDSYLEGRQGQHPPGPGAATRRASPQLSKKPSPPRSPA